MVLLALTLVLGACGDKNNNDNGKENNSEKEDNNKADNKADNNADNNADKDFPKFLSMLTGGTSGTYYPLGGEMAKIISDETGVQTDAVSSNASADNVQDLHDDQAEIAFVQTDVVANAVEGTNAFEGNQIDDILALGSLYPETVQIVTTDKAGITSVEDLAGKKVSVGAPGSGTYINAEQILEIHGMSMDDIDAQHLDFGESTGGIQDGNIAAAFITAGTPTGAVEGLSATETVSIVPIEQDKVDELIEKYPYYAADTVESGTYGLESDVSTVAVLAMLIVKDDLSEDLVYEMTKAIYENAETMAHDKAKFIRIENAMDGIGIDLHPGAEKYFTEEGLLD